MARSQGRNFARIRLSLAEDDHFESLTVDAQWLYLRVLLPDPSLSYCGIADWRPNRLVGKARGMTIDRMLDAAAELEHEHYALFDTDTEEAMLRSFIRGDELLRNPKMAAAVVRDYRRATSKALRAMAVTECRRVKEENPDYSSWDCKDTAEDLAQLLTKPDSTQVLYTVRYADRITNGITNQNTNRIGNRNGNAKPVDVTDADSGPEHQSDSVDIPCHLAPSTGNHPPSTKESSAPNGAAARGRRLEKGWIPDESLIAEMREKCPGVDLKHEHEKFVDYWCAQPGAKGRKLDWPATWRNWIRHAWERLPASAGSQATSDQRVAAVQALKQSGPAGPAVPAPTWRVALP